MVGVAPIFWDRRREKIPNFNECHPTLQLTSDADAGKLASNAGMQLEPRVYHRKIMNYDYLNNKTAAGFNSPFNRC